MPSMPKFILSKWKRLSFHSGSRRLSMFALLMMFALDAFVLSLVLEGTTDVQRLVNAPRTHISDSCLQLSAGVLEYKVAARISAFAQFAEEMSEGKERAIADFNGEDDKLLHACAQIRDKLIATFSDTQLLALFNERDRIKQEMEKIENDIKKLKDSYSNALLEKIANQNRSESILPVEAGKIKGVLTEMTTEQQGHKLRLEQLDAALTTHAGLEGYLAYVSRTPVQGALLAEQDRVYHLTKWYPVKLIAAQVGFMLPLLLLAIFWNNRAINHQRDTQIMISSHLILVGALPIVLKVLSLIRDVLPQQLLDRVLYFLQQWKLSFLWYYLVIFASVCAGLLFVFIAQRAFFTPTRQRLIRLRKALCVKCGEKLRAKEQKCCEMCGAQQSAPCGHCGQPRRILAFHCHHCGLGAPQLLVDQ